MMAERWQSKSDAPHHVYCKTVLIIIFSRTSTFRTVVAFHSNRFLLSHIVPNSLISVSERESKSMHDRHEFYAFKNGSLPYVANR